MMNKDPSVSPLYLLCPLLCAVGMDHVTPPVVMSLVMCSLNVLRDDIGHW